MMRKIHIQVVGALIITILSFSCKKTLNLPSSHLVPIHQMWKTKNDARSAVFATYGLLRAALANNNAYLVYGELRSGDFKSVSNTNLKAVISNNLNANSQEIETWANWRRFYATIAQANLCISKLPEVHKNDFRYTDDELKLDIANVRFVRALTYFYLVRIWGDVPLVTALVGNGFRQVRRTTKDSVLDYASQETLEVLKDLPWQYNGEFPEQQGQYWGNSASFWFGKVATKGSAYALLAHIAAWEGDYFDVAKYTKLITDNKSQGGYDWSFTSTVTSTADNGTFRGKAVDDLFFLSFSDEYQESSATGHIEAWTMARPYIDQQTPTVYVNNDSIINVFSEQKDERFYIDSNGIAIGDYFTGFGNPIPLFSKIRLITTSGDHPLTKYQSDIVVFRYEEIELLRAEAFYFLGDEANALQWLNAERSQRGLADFEGSGGALGNAILQERRRELMGEGWRWYDLIRFGKVTEYTGISKQEVQQGALLWPIASDILSGNKNIHQNQFWQ